MRQLSPKRIKYHESADLFKVFKISLFEKRTEISLFVFRSALSLFLTQSYRYLGPYDFRDAETAIYRISGNLAKENTEAQRICTTTLQNSV